MEQGERNQVLVATVLEHDPKDFGPNIPDHVTDVRAQYLYEMGQEVPGGAVYAGVDIGFKEDTPDWARSRIQEEIDTALADPADIGANEGRIYAAGGRVVHRGVVRDEDKSREVFEEKLDHLRGNPIITHEGIVRAQMSDRLKQVPDKAFGEVKAIYPQGDKAIVEVDPGGEYAQRFFAEVPSRKLGTYGHRHPDGVNFGDTVRFDRSLPEPERLRKVDLEAMEKLSVKPGAYHVVPLGVLPESRAAVVAHAGREKVLDTSMNPAVEQELAGHLGKPVQIRVDRVVRLSVVPMERGQEKGVQR
jgi:hypothetical protein